MDRRAFLIGAMAPLIAPPRAIRAQDVARGARVGVLLHDGAPPGLLEAFQAGLRERGYVPGQNIVIETRDAHGNNGRLDALAAELVRLKVDLILALNTPAAEAARKATSTIPIVIARVSDPVTSGLVRSLARPGGNVTGLSFSNTELAIKGLQLLKEALPSLARVAILSNANNRAHTPQVAALSAAAPQLGLELIGIPMREPSGLPRAFQIAIRARAEAMFVLDDTAITRQRDDVLRLAALHSLPVASRYRDFAEAGGLIAYGPDLPAMYRRAAHYADRILKGDRASELPLEQPSKFDLVINLKTARALGLAIPPLLLAQANHVIQ